MHTNRFGDPKPSSLDEINQAFDWIGANPKSCYAQISPPNPAEEQEHFKGWTAEVFTNDGDEVFDTCGFQTCEDLMAALSSAGVPEAMIETLDAA